MCLSFENVKDRHMSGNIFELYLDSHEILWVQLYHSTYLFDTRSFSVLDTIKHPFQKHNIDYFNKKKHYAGSQWQYLVRFLERPAALLQMG